MDCNRDCFNCTFEDCVINTISDEERVEIDNRGIKASRRKELAQKRKYYQDHKEHLDAKHKQYEQEHIEKVREYKRNWARKNYISRKEKEIC